MCKCSKTVALRILLLGQNSPFLLLGMGELGAILGILRSHESDYSSFVHATYTIGPGQLWEAPELFFPPARWWPIASFNVVGCLWPQFNSLVRESQWRLSKFWFAWWIIETSLSSSMTQKLLWRVAFLSCTSTNIRYGQCEMGHIICH